MARRPLSVRGSPENWGEHDGPHEGVPAGLRTSLIAWLVQWFFFVDDVYGERYPNHELMMKFERIHGRPLPLPTIGPFGKHLNENPELILDAVDFVLGELQPSIYTGEPEAVEELVHYLAEARSVYTVGRDQDGRYELQRFVPPEVLAAAEQAMSASDRASEHLHAAWSKAYGRDPDPSGAYGHAVKAVEAAGKPVVSPENLKTTLGTMIRDLEAKPSKWSTVIDADGDIEKVIEMMKLLWYGEYRHGDESKPVTVTPEAAEAALHLAVTLVHWFRSAAIRRVEG